MVHVSMSLCALSQSTDYGVTWSNFPAPPPTTVRSVTADPASGSSVVWVVGANCISRWDGHSWGACMAPGSKQDYRELTISPADSTKMFLVVNAGTAMRTADGGATWVPVSDPNVNAATSQSYQVCAAYS